MCILEGKSAQLVQKKDISLCCRSCRESKELKKERKTIPSNVATEVNICNHETGITRSRGTRRLLCLLSKVNTLNGRHISPPSQAPSFQFPTWLMNGWTMGGRVHHKSSAMKVLC